MAQQNRNAYAYNYNYNRNEKVVSYNGSAAPKVRPEPQKKPQLELVKKTRLTAQQMRQQTAAETRKTILLVTYTNEGVHSLETEYKKQNVDSYNGFFKNLNNYKIYVQGKNIFFYLLNINTHHHNILYLQFYEFHLLIQPLPKLHH